MKKKNYFIHLTSIVDKSSKIGEGTKVWHFSHIMKKVTIGKNCNIGQNVFIGNNVKIGKNVKIQNNVSVYEGVELDDYVFCGPSVTFTNVLKPRSEFPVRGRYQKTLIKKGVTLGANSTIICGVSIGEYAFIGAAAVVTKDIPAYALAYGNPAKIQGWVCKCGLKLKFENKMAWCDYCKRRYLKKNKYLVENII